MVHLVFETTLWSQILLLVLFHLNQQQLLHWSFEQKSVCIILWSGNGRVIILSPFQIHRNESVVNGIVWIMKLYSFLFHYFHGGHYILTSNKASELERQELQWVCFGMFWPVNNLIFTREILFILGCVQKLFCNMFLCLIIYL